MKSADKRTTAAAGESGVSQSSRMTNVELCTTYLLQKIESGEIRPETRLGEPSLAKAIGVDRGAVRAAFERLEASGILQRVPRSGTYLRQTSLEDVRATNQVRAQLEILGAGLAAKHATREETGHLLKAAQLLDDLTETYVNGEFSVWTAIRSLEIEFHTMIARYSHNPVLLSMMSRDSFLQTCFPFLVVSTRLRQDELREYLQGSVAHVDLAKAIQKKDVSLAEQLIKKHVEDAAILFERCLHEQGKMPTKQKP